MLPINTSHVLFIQEIKSQLTKVRIPWSLTKICVKQKKKEKAIKATVIFLFIYLFFKNVKSSSNTRNVVYLELGIKRT